MIGRCLPLTGNTPNTTRFQGRDQYETAVAVSQAVWASPADPMMRPGAVILARGDGMCYQDALVSSPLMHFPRNGPVLLTEPTQLSHVVRQEILRLSPTGKSAPAQVLTIGSLSMSVDEEVRRLGFTVCRVGGPDPVATAVAVWDIVGTKRQVMLVSGNASRKPCRPPVGPHTWKTPYSSRAAITCRPPPPAPSGRPSRTSTFSAVRGASRRR